MTPTWIIITEKISQEELACGQKVLNRLSQLLKSNYKQMKKKDTGLEIKESKNLRILLKC